MEQDIFKKVKDAFLSRADEMTTWIGIIGVTLLLLHMHGLLFWICVVLIFLPDAKFSDLFANWTKSLREMDKK